MSYVVSKSFGAWYDAVQSLVPQNTVVGRLLQGDYSGAASGAIRFAAQAGKAPTGGMVQPVKPPTAPGLFTPGGFIEKNQTILLLAAAGLAAFLVLGKKRR